MGWHSQLWYENVAWTLENYDALLDAKIRQKTRNLMRASMLQGEIDAKTTASEFATKFECGVKRVRESKIACIIDRAEALVTEALHHDPTMIVAMVHKLFRNIAEHTDVEITAHPDDVATIKAALQDDGHAHTAVRKVSYQDDEGFIRGSLVIKANKSIIDAQIKTELERARTLIVQRLENKHG